jgi:hypothetical protein
MTVLRKIHDAKVESPLRAAAARETGPGPGPGADTQVVAHIPLSQLRQLPGAADLEDAWIRARLGEDGYLAGQDAAAAACDAQIVPVVTGTMDPPVIDQMIDLARTAAQAGTPGPGGPGPVRCRLRRGGRCATRWPTWPSTWSPAPPASPRFSARDC